MSSYTQIAILGRQPELGLVELESLLGPDALMRFGLGVTLLEGDVNLNQLGGVIKLGTVLYHGPVKPLSVLKPYRYMPARKTKVTFGLSFYGGQQEFKPVEVEGLTLKKELRERAPVRLILPKKGRTLKAAELKYNKVLENGFELLVATFGDEMVIAKTTAVQDIDWYSKRDYKRPSRSAKVGMLPPKLAQVMVNTTGSRLVADPFCGTGVILQEARLMGREAFGSDLYERMVSSTSKNMEWLDTQVEPEQHLPEWSALLSDARTVELPDGCAVVSEGYLGPNLTKLPKPDQLAKMKAELLPLYRDTLKNFARQLPSGGEVTICIPAWKVPARWDYLGIVDELGDLGYTLKSFSHGTNPLLYARDDQVVGRQLLMLRKI